MEFCSALVDGVDTASSAFGDGVDTRSDQPSSVIRRNVEDVANDRHPPVRLIVESDAALAPLVALVEAKGSFRTTTRTSSPSSRPRIEYVLSITDLDAHEAKWLTAFIGCGSALAPQGGKRTRWRYVLSGRVAVGEVLVRTVPLMSRSRRRVEAERLLTAVFARTGGVLCAAPRCGREATVDRSLCGWHSPFFKRAVVIEGACVVCGWRRARGSQGDFTVIHVVWRLSRSRALCAHCTHLMAEADAHDPALLPGLRTTKANG